jgi:selenide,water dikinase
MVGFDGSDDAAVYRVRDDLAVIQTIDFFPPIVDDPYTFGQIAAANAISDVYAMGGEPKIALNLLCVSDQLTNEAIRAILEGGADKAMEAGISIAGGHSIVDIEPKYGMAVTGFCHPDNVRTNNGAREGDLLILTKPLGSGILTTALSAGLLDDAATADVTRVMAHLNKYAAEAMQRFSPSACTDVTGFGLLGHAAEMAVGSGLGMVIESSRVPLFGQAAAFARDGIIPGGAYRNRDFLKDKVLLEDDIPRDIADVLFDPQTSGGLLIAIHERDADTLVSSLRAHGETAVIIGQLTARKEAAVIVRK